MYQGVHEHRFDSCISISENGYELSTVTRPESPDSGDDLTTRKEFDAALERVVAAARDRDVELEGAYNVRAPCRKAPDYTIEIAKQTKQAPEDGD